MLKSLRPLGPIVHEIGPTKVNIELRKLPSLDLHTIEQSRAFEAFEWFTKEGQSQVYVIQLKSPGRRLHAVCVDTKNGLVIDNFQPCALRLSTASLWVCAGSGVGDRRIQVRRLIAPLHETVDINNAQ